MFYWHLAGKTKDIELYKLVIEIGKAFQTWQRVLAPLKIESTSDPKKAHIKIHFVQNGHPILQGHEFGSVNGFGFYPDSERAGEIYLNDEKDWTDSKGNKPVFRTLRHEIGHTF